MFWMIRNNGDGAEHERKYSDFKVIALKRI